MRSRNAHFARFLITSLAIIFVLMAGTVQVCHICGLEGVGSSHSVQDLGDLTSNNGVCPICLTAQTANSPVAAIAPAPQYAAVAEAVAPPIYLHQAPQHFSLYIRPPPSL